MTEIPALDDILAKRKDRSTVLGQLCDRVAKQGQELLKLSQSLAQVDGGDSFTERLSDLTTLSDSFHAKASRLHSRLSCDYLTFALVGLEKAGKSTFINNFAGLFLNPYDRSAGGYLPSGEARCTASIAELCNSSDNSFDVVYYSEQELIEDIINPMLHLVNLPEISEKKHIAKIHLEDHHFGAYPEIQERLQKIKNCTAFITAEERTESGKAVTPENLALFLSHDSTEEKLPLVKKVVIHRPLLGSAAKIRFIDTPGINDPNPNAKQKTLSIAQKEADIIVMASRPVKPSLENNDAAFLESLYKSFSGVEMTGQKIVWLMNTYCVPKDQNFVLHKLDINKRTHNSLGDRIYKCDFQNEDLSHTVSNHILSHAQRILPLIDEQEMAAFQKEFAAHHAELRSLAEAISDRYRGETVDQEAQFFEEQFRTWFEQFTEELALLSQRSSDYTEYNNFALQAFAEWHTQLDLPDEETWNKWTKTARESIGGKLAQDFTHNTFKFLRELCDDYATVLAEEIQEDVIEFFEKLGCAGIYAATDGSDPRSKLIALRDSCKNLKTQQSADLVSAFTDLIDLKASLQRSFFDRVHSYLSELQNFEIAEPSNIILTEKINQKIADYLCESKVIENNRTIPGNYTKKFLAGILSRGQDRDIQSQARNLWELTNCECSHGWTSARRDGYIEGGTSLQIAKNIDKEIQSLRQDHAWISSSQRHAIAADYNAWLSYVQGSVGQLETVLKEKFTNAETDAAYAFNDFTMQVGTLQARFKFLGNAATLSHHSMMHSFIHTNRDKLGFLTESDAAEQMRLFREIQKTCVELEK